MAKRTHIEKPHGRVYQRSSGRPRYEALCGQTASRQKIVPLDSGAATCKQCLRKAGRS